MLKKGSIFAPAKGKTNTLEYECKLLKVHKNLVKI